MVHGPAVAAGDGEAGQRVWDAGVDLQAVQRGLHTEDVLADIEEGPGGGAGQPAVLCLAEGRGVDAGDHLAVDIRLGAVDLGDVLDVGGAGLLVDFKGTVAVAKHSLGAADPRIVVAEDACILLVSRRVAGDLAEVEAVGLIMMQ